MADVVVTCNQLITGIPRDKRFIKRFIAIDQNKILKVGEGDGQDYIDDATTVISLKSDEILIPGFIDLHIHGAHGADVMDGTEEAVQTMTANLPAEGTTSFLATTITMAPQAINRAIENAVSAGKLDGHAEVIGIHIEGPFINESKKGAQPLKYIMEPSFSLLNEWFKTGKGMIKQMTYAPELSQGVEFTRFLQEKGINPSVGHSDADYRTMVAAVDAGANQVTHMFNGMSGVHHREPGVAGSALLLDKLDIELIVDGIHIHPEMVKLAWKTKGTDRCLLITDSMRAKGFPDGNYELGGQAVTVEDNKATLTSDGTLAGSVLKMNDAVANMLAFTGCSLEDAIQMASYNPARKAGVLDRKGSIEEGKDADFTVVNKNGEITLTFCRGKEAFRKEGR